MRTIIAGSRSINDIALVDKVMQSCPWPITFVLTGGARGVDQIAEQIAKVRKIHGEVYLADWEQFGKTAGFRRNVQMADDATALVAIWDGESKGTAHMIKVAKEKGLRVAIYNPAGELVEDNVDELAWRKAQDAPPVNLGPMADAVSTFAILFAYANVQFELIDRFINNAL